MEVAKWTPDQQTLYLNQKMQALEARLAQEDLEREAREAREEAEKAFEKGKLKGEIKGKISKVKALIKYNVPKENIVQDLKFLTDVKVLENLDNHLDYIKEHNDETDSLICENLGLVGTLSSDLEALDE